MEQNEGRLAHIGTQSFSGAADGEAKSTERRTAPVEFDREDSPSPAGGARGSRDERRRSRSRRRGRSEERGRDRSRSRRRGRGDDDDDDFNLDDLIDDKKDKKRR